MLWCFDLERNLQPAPENYGGSEQIRGEKKYFYMENLDSPLLQKTLLVFVEESFFNVFSFRNVFSKTNQRADRNEFIIRSFFQVKDAHPDKIRNKKGIRERWTDLKLWNDHLIF